MFRRILLQTLIFSAVSHVTLSDDLQLIPFNDFCSQISCVTPAPWGDILLSVPNEGDTERIALLARLHEKTIYLWGVAPVSPTSGRGVPMGMAFGDDENLYLCDDQSRLPGGGEGRILRLLVNPSHRPYAAQLVASGITMPHRIGVLGDYLYVTQYFHPVQESSDVWQSGLYRFPIHVENIPVTSLPDDPSLIHTFSLTNPEKKQIPVSLCLDSSGKLYVGNPAEGVIVTLTFDEQGKVRETTEYLRAEQLSSIDGMAADESGNLYVGNAISHTLFRVTPDKKMETILEGEERGFRHPRDLCVRNGVLYFTCETAESTPAVGIWTLPEGISAAETPNASLPE